MKECEGVCRVGGEKWVGEGVRAEEGGEKGVVVCSSPAPCQVATMSALWIKPSNIFICVPI
jgi:hypothetical protein